jgi:hypothetical protein
VDVERSQDLTEVDGLLAGQQFGGGVHEFLFRFATTRKNRLLILSSLVC